ncbi:umecyanin-like [Momordica charantia]|uniref:Umecyanin-like n=1 Tax=Momordica charantia TaxID=3673 RepID=A0A6J1CVB4_MOMCH|nr:umecyanin-like [Momordica charantia]
MATRLSLVASLFVVGALLHVVAAVDHDVGGDFGWNLPPNSTFFSDWSRSRTFSVGDKLVFRSKATESHDVAEPPSQADFDGCVKPGITFGTSAVFSITLDRPRRRYFICTIGSHCNAGMKFVVDIVEQPGAPNSAVEPPPPPPSSGSSLRVGAVATFTGFILTIIA